jgi:hypothetical protein
LFGGVAMGGETYRYWNGGVAVLETNRLFGGDSGYYYLGNYTIKDSQSSNRRRRAIDLTQISNFTIAARIGYRQCVLVLRRVNPDKRFGILLHGPPSAH